jgi:hypothetical protein
VLAGRSLGWNLLPPVICVKYLCIRKERVKGEEGWKGERTLTSPGNNPAGAHGEARSNAPIEVTCG